MRKLGVKEWIIGLVQALYNGANCRIRVNGKLGQPFDVKVGLHQGSVLSPLLFIIVLEALSKEFRTGCPWELLYADDLVIVSHSLADLQQRFDAWKSGMEAKGLRAHLRALPVVVRLALFPFSCREETGFGEEDEEQDG